MFSSRCPRFLVKRHLRMSRIRQSNTPQLAENNTKELLNELKSVLNNAESRKELSKHLQASDVADLRRMLRGTHNRVREDNSKEIQSNGHHEISPQVLMLIAIQHGVPFFGFGFIDNAIMILAGDSIDITLGASLGISSMAAAAIGNIFADVSGLGLSGIIEDKSAKIGIRAPLLSSMQLLDKRARFAKVLGRTIGVTLGCLLGMLPLLFLDTRSY